MDAIVLQFPDRRPLVRLALVPPIQRRRVPTLCTCALVVLLGLALAVARRADPPAVHTVAPVTVTSVVYLPEMRELHTVPAVPTCPGGCQAAMWVRP